jgi:hypothetical protein
VLVETGWSAARTDGASAPLTLKSTFIVRRETAGLRIVFYLNHQDLAAVLAPAQRPDSAP